MEALCEQFAHHDVGVLYLVDLGAGFGTNDRPYTPLGRFVPSIDSSRLRAQLYSLHKTEGNGRSRVADLRPQLEIDHQNERQGCACRITGLVDL